MNLLNLILLLSLPIILFISLIFVQKYICKNFNIKLGIILPLIYIIPVILFVIYFILITISIFVSSDYKFIYSHTSDNTLIIGIIIQLINIFLLLSYFILSSLVYFLIYIYYKKKRTNRNNNEENYNINNKL